MNKIKLFLPLFTVFLLISNSVCCQFKEQRNKGNIGKFHAVNPCDSMTKIVLCKTAISASAMCTTIKNALLSYVVNSEEAFSVQKLNDSTLVASGIFKIRKRPLMVNRVYGSYTIRSNSDGFISYKLFIQCKGSAFRYEYANLNHYGCSRTYKTNLCDSVSYSKDLKTNLIAKGLKIQFLERTVDQVQLIKKSLELSEW